jgi:DNA-binding transcriptional MerR regulator
MTTLANPSRKIGELADALGVAVRTQHYYEEIDLLVPSERTDAGHRLHGPSEVERLYRICLLRQLGLPLDGVRTSLDVRLAAENRLRARLARLVGAIDVDAEPTFEILDVLEDMKMLETTINKPISVLVCIDIEAQFKFLTVVGSGTIWLHLESPEFELASSASVGKSTTTMVALVDDVDARHAHAASLGATIRYAPCDQPYSYREYSANDSEGHLWSFMKPLDA